jgi:hypothetical protein
LTQALDKVYLSYQFTREKVDDGISHASTNPRGAPYWSSPCWWLRRIR